MFRSPDSFIKGAKVRVAEAFDCATCEVTISQPIPENEIIIDLYEALPHNYDGYTGAKNVGAESIKFVFELYEIHPDLWDDYYNRIQFFHQELLNAKTKTERKKQKREDTVKKMKQGQAFSKPASSKECVRAKK